MVFENEDTTFRVKEDLKKFRIIRKPKFHDKIINETPYDSCQRKYEINVYNVTLDIIIGSLEKRLSKHEEIICRF